MHDLKKTCYPCNTFFKKSFLYLALVILFSPSIAHSHPCEGAGKDLRGDWGVVANRGGLWSLMEQRGLKDNSVIGMQADGKLARVVSQFETLCESDKKPPKQLYLAVRNIIGEARVIFNPNTGGAAVTKSIHSLIKNLDALLAKMK